MAKQQKQKILEVEKSPFQNLYYIDLACGHQVTRRRFMEGLEEIECFECKQEKRNRFRKKGKK